MWIQTQNKQRIINSDQIIDIFVGRTGTKIVANTTCYDLDASEVILGEYQDRETCMKILEALTLIGVNIPLMAMPLGGEIETWLKTTDELARYYIVKEFK